jgi:hypothetical protein
VAVVRDFENPAVPATKGVDAARDLRELEAELVLNYLAITETRLEIRIGERYFFQPRMCMLQWRHSGLVNYLNRTPNGLQVRVEGLWIG